MPGRCHDWTGARSRCEWRAGQRLGIPPDSDAAALGRPLVDADEVPPRFLSP